MSGHCHTLWQATVALTALAGQLLATDYWVDGTKGLDEPQRGTITQPWRTIEYSLVQIPTPTWPNSQRLFVAGGQTYALTRTLVMKYNVRLIGDTPNRPVLKAAGALGSLVRFDPAVVYNRKEAGLESFVLDGAGYAIEIGGLGTNRHRPSIDHCLFNGQTTAGVRIAQSGTAICDARFLDCTFQKGRTGIEATAIGQDSVLRPDIDECIFQGLSAAGYALADRSSGVADVGGLVRASRFENCARGIDVLVGTNAPNTHLDIHGSWFKACSDAGIVIFGQRPADPYVTVEGCTFLGNGTGLRVHGSFEPGTYTFVVRGNVLQAQRGNAVEFSLQRGVTPGARFRIISSSNQAVHNAGLGVSLVLSGVDAVMDSLGDRFLENSGGMSISGGSSATSIVVACGIMAANRQNGVSVGSGPAFRGSFLTLADNAGYGLAYTGPTAQAALDHCLIARNRAGELSAQASLPVSYTLLETQTWPGTGNMTADPRLVRPLYKLALGSPAIEKGDPVARTPATDYEGDPRVVLAGYGAPRPDIGADEFVPSGSAQVYGVTGFGRRGFQPRIGVPATQDGVRMGSSLQVDLVEARDLFSVTAVAAALLFGSKDDPAPLLPDLSVVGSPGSLLQIDYLGVLPWVAIDPQGYARVRLPIPSDPRLNGLTVTFQWLVFKPGCNAAGFVTTRGLRATLGQ